jgi:molecular chaperone GrpE
VSERRREEETAKKGDSSEAKGGNGDSAPEGSGDGPPDDGGLAESSGAVGGEPRSPDLVETLRKERDELRDQLLRKRADFENFRRRAERDRLQAGQEAVATFLRELIPSLDNLERALQSGAEEGSLRAGVELTYRELKGLLENHGVVAHDPTGQPFDPNRHQALLHEAAPGFEEGTVVEVFRKGYTLHDRLLRPALVKVAKGDDPGEGTESGGIH